MNVQKNTASYPRRLESPRRRIVNGHPITSTAETVSWSNYLYAAKPCWEANSSTAVQTFPALYGIGKFIVIFTTARQFSLSWTEFVLTTPSHPLSLRSTWILSCHLHLDLQSGTLSSGFSNKILRPFRATCTTHLILLGLFTLIISDVD